MVRIVRYGEQHFQQHPYLKWTDFHETKAILGQAGVLQETCAVPPMRDLEDDVADGRRRHFREGGPIQLRLIGVR